ncbi:MAG: cysteine desulfurase family protein [Bacteroidota bacterium]|nr:cysteine desulfurase family protein [Bacteroidota bacterium]
MFDSDPIYLDYNATTPVDPTVADAMRPYLDTHFGNPSSPHAFGLETNNAIARARNQVADLLGCQSDEIIFTSGGTESNNMAIKGVAFAHQHKGNHIITSSIEHPAVIEVCRYLENKGFEVTYLPVDKYGMVNPDDLQESIKEETILVSIMHANNEVGTIQPIREMTGICKANNTIFHTDAAQSLGKIPVKVQELGVDLLSVAGHKLYAPKGIGALYVRNGIVMEKFIHGANHENNRRAGTENVLEIVGLGKACEIADRDLIKNIEHLVRMRDLLHQGLIDHGLEFHLNGHSNQRLSNTLSIGFKDINVTDLLYSMLDVAVSAGAACHANGIRASSVLQAMSVPDAYANGTVRFSVGKYTTPEEIKEAIKVVVNAVHQTMKNQAQ